MQRLSPAALALGLLAVSIPATVVAGEVYQWKDARGVTQYSSTPPANGAYKVRTIRVDGQAQAVATPAKPAENPACATARGNIALLQGKTALQIDSDGDGKPDKVLSDDDRANQLQLAQATLKASCQDAPAGSPAPAS